MKPKIFAIVNLVGCLVLIVCMAIQGLINSGLQQKLHDVYAEQGKLQDDRDLKASRIAGLERDTEDLKNQLESSRKEVNTVQTELTALKEQNANHQADLDAAKSGVEEWQKGIAQRDAQIEELKKNIGLYKARLDEAVAELRKVAAERRAQR